MKKDSFVALRDWAEQLEELPEKDQLELFWAVFRYGLDGEEPELKTYQKAIFRGFKNDIDRNQERYEALVEKRRQNGRKGAQARWQNMATDGKNGNTIFANGKNGLDVDVDVDDNDDVSSKEDDVGCKIKPTPQPTVDNILERFFEENKSHIDQAYISEEEFYTLGRKVLSQWELSGWDRKYILAGTGEFQALKFIRWIKTEKNRKNETGHTNRLQQRRGADTKAADGESYHEPL